MSYILDALQRAELERERASGTVPGLQTRSIATPAATQKEAAGARNRWLVFAAISLLAIAVISFLLWRQAPVSTPVASLASATSPVTAPAANPSAAPAATAAATAAPSAAPPVAPAASPVAAAVAMASVASPTVAAPKPINAKPPTPAAVPASAVRAKAEAAESVVASAPAPRPAEASVPPTPLQRSASAPQAPKVNLPLVKDLPEAIRAQMPPLSVSGVVYSDNPAQRLLLLNGQVVPQGSRVADDLVLDEIHAKSSDFTFRGTRFKLGH
jgi:general secretion pathway protein B